MVNALIYHIASGQAFFSGVALLHLAAILSLGAPNRGRALARTIAALTGLLLIGASATPLPITFYCVAVGIALTWLVLEDRRISVRPKARPILFLAALAPWWLGLAWEIPYHMNPRLPARSDRTLFVVGDSVTAGMGGEAVTWPGIIGRQHGIYVKDLSLSGATASTARGQAARVDIPGAMVLVEIGGNDLLGGTKPAAFEASLDAILARLRADGDIVVMLELPLPPTYNTFGAIQRRLARRHGVYLVPKRVLLGVLESEGATLDSIHLSPAGHALMARSIWRVIGAAFVKGARQYQHSINL